MGRASFEHALQSSSSVLYLKEVPPALLGIQRRPGLEDQQSSLCHHRCVTSAQAGFLSCVQCRTRGKSTFRAAEGFLVLLFTALRFPAHIPASSESQFSCEMLYCFICGFQLSPSCLHLETLLFTCLSFFFLLHLPDSFLRSFRSKGCPLSPAPSAHVLCSYFSHRRHLVSLMSCPGCSPPPPFIARLPPWEPHAHCCLCT